MNDAVKIAFTPNTPQKYKNMTYKQLITELSLLNEDQLNQTVTTFDPYTDEYTAIVHTETTSESDILDENHFYLVLKA